MIIPVADLPSTGYTSGLALQETEVLTSRLAVLSELYLRDPGDAVAGENDAVSHKSLLMECDIRVGPFDILAEDHDESTTKAVVAWLDSGARRAILRVDVSTPDSVRDLADWTRELPASRHRLIAAIRAGDLRTGAGSVEEALSTVMEGLRPIVGCLQVDFGEDYDLAPKILAQLKTLRGREGASDYLEIVFTQRGVDGSHPVWSPEEIGRLHLDHGVDVQCPAFLKLPGGVVNPPKGTGGTGGAVDAVEAFLACTRTDRTDELIPTVVCDTTGVALGLVYSNAASIRESLESGRGVYWSRSRGALWRKGDTSGAWQELRGVSLDCDSDALRFTVRQHGDPAAFCHFNRRNCWKGDRGLGHLERTLAKRKEEAPEGSYTKRLFEDPELLRNKLVEEAQELAEASTRKHVAEEAADVTYFMMARCAAVGVGVEDIEKELDMRSLKLKRRAGNAKTERIAAGDRILGAGRQTSVTETT